MSMPIAVCEFWKAATGDEAMYKSVLSRMFYNRRWGAWTQFACPHKPPCEKPTDEQIEAFEKRFNADLKDPVKRDEFIKSMDS